MMRMLHELFAPTRTDLPKVPEFKEPDPPAPDNSPPAEPKPERIRQPVKEVIRLLLEKRPLLAEDSHYGGYISRYTTIATVAGVQVEVVQTSGGYCGPIYSATLTYGDHALKVTHDEAEALYDTFTEMRGMDYADKQMAARDAISAHLGVSTTP